MCSFGVFQFPFSVQTTSRKKLKPGSIPTLMMPMKSHATNAKQRRKIERSEYVQPKSKSYIYRSFKDLSLRVKNLKLAEWIVVCSEDRVILQKQEADCFIPRYEICIDDSLGYYIQVYGWLLPEDHPLYTVHHRSMRNISASNLVADLEKYKICCGSSVTLASMHTVNHIVPRKFDPLIEESNIRHKATEFCRSVNCMMICLTEKCQECNKAENYVRKKFKNRQRNLATASKLNAPIATTHPEKLKLTIQGQRLKCSQLEAELDKMRTELQKNTVLVDNELGKDFSSIINESQDSDMTPFMKLFWQEQKKLFSHSIKGQRYHPMIIRFCLSLQSKSPAAYKEFRDALGRKNGGILTLPCKRTLRDYKNWIRPKCGFNDDVVLELIGITDKYFGVQRYVVLLFDEMKIRADLVYDKNSNELIGFVDLGAPDVNFGVLEEVTELASHVLLFMVRGLATDLCFSLAYFATKGAVSYELFTLFWEAIGVLELNNLWVIASTSDGASSNRRFIKMHADEQSDETASVVYYTVNHFSPDRNIYFFSDAPHLVKTLRNCLYHSGSGTCTRYMWKDGKYLPWQYIVQLYDEDQENGLKLLPKITSDHIQLSSYSAMRVNLAAQVLSSTVAAVLKECGSPDASETSNLCKMMDDFFDCLNVRSLKEHKLKRKPFLAPYTSVSDPRFEYLENAFLNYFKEWQKSIADCSGGWQRY